METMMINSKMQFSEYFPRPEIEKLILPHRKSMFNRALQLCKDSDLADDLVQDSVFQGIKNLHQLKDHSKSKYWLLSILRNQFLKEYFKSEKSKNWANDRKADYILEENFPEKEYLADEDDRELRYLVEGLDERLRTPLKMFYFQNFLYKDISAKLSIPMGTVMSRISRARVHLKKKLLDGPGFSN